MKVYSYQRFSSMEQGKGDSLKRQGNLAMEWCKRNGHQLAETFIDSGISAFKGDNLKKGSLGHFLKLVDDGLIEKNSILLVESWDRLSRLPVVESTELFTALIRRGLTIVFLQPERIVNYDSIVNNPFSLIEIVIVGIRSNEESLTKSKRVKAALIREKESTLNGKALLKLCPPWLKVENNKYEILPDKVDIIKKIFQMYGEGYGPYTIAKQLNQQNIAPLGRGNTTSTKGVSKQWYKLGIERILKDKRLIGYCEYNQKSDYFPQVIDESTFYKAVSTIKRRPLKPGRSSASCKNLFKGLLICGCCGGGICRADKVRFGYLHKYLACENARTGKNCSYETFKYDYLEETFFDLVDHDFYKQFKPAEDDISQDKLIKMKLDEAVAQVEKLTNLVVNDNHPSKALVNKLKHFESLVDDLSKQYETEKLNQLDKQILDDNELRAEIRNNLANLLGTPDGRAKAATYIRNTVDKIVIHRRTEHPIYINVYAYTVIFRNKYVATTSIVKTGKHTIQYQQRPGNQILFDPGDNYMVYDGEISVEYKK